MPGGGAGDTTRLEFLAPFSEGLDENANLFLESGSEHSKRISINSPGIFLRTPTQSPWGRGRRFKRHYHATLSISLVVLHINIQAGVTMTSTSAPIPASGAGLPRPPALAQGQRRGPAGRARLRLAMGDTVISTKHDSNDSKITV